METQALTIESVALTDIRLDGGTQSREDVSSAVIEEYAELMRDGVTFPPVRTVYDGSEHWLWEGFHRIGAVQLNGWTDIQAEVRPGTRRDAVLLAAKANRENGRERTPTTKRRQIEMLLRDEEWAKWSDREIARWCGVDGKTVAARRQAICGNSADVTRLVERNGITYEQRLPTMQRVEAVDWSAYVQDRTAKFQAREERHREIAARNRDLDLGARTYSVILADPPWEYNNVGVNGAAENHYPTVSTERLCSDEFPVARHAGEDAVLFMWATNALLEDSLRVVRAWGFQYKTNFVWHKLGGRVGTGWYNQQDHELLLVATRGGGMTAMDRRSSVIVAQKDEHSRKPEVVYEIIESMYPGAAYLELFARNRHSDAWDVWGNQAPADEAAKVGA